MNLLDLALIAIAVLGIAVAVAAAMAPRATRRPALPAALPTDADGWTRAAGAEFANLSESARCEMVFAVGALDDERAQQLLEHALGDPSAAVALAAAHTLVGGGRAAVVEAFLRAHPGEHAERIAQALDLLGSRKD